MLSLPLIKKPQNLTRNLPLRQLRHQELCSRSLSIQSMPRSPQARPDFIRVLINTKPTSLPTVTAA